MKGLDTTRNLEEAFDGDRPRRRMRIDVTSFGFKRGVPRVLDLLFDVRFLPNPHWIPELRRQTGRDEDVRDYVLNQGDSAEFMTKVDDMLDFLVPRYESEGKAYLTIGIGCTGGRHRSVAIAEEIARRLEARGVDVTVSHRDVEGGS